MEKESQLSMFNLPPVESKAVSFDPAKFAEAIPKTQDAEQPALFEKGEWWDSLWNGMPEFVQEDQEPYRTIYVHFENRADVEAFAELVKQKITANTKSIWYPEAEIGHFSGKCYKAESEDDGIEVIEDEP
jgi:hypothetical protein